MEQTWAPREGVEGRAAAPTGGVVALASLTWGGGGVEEARGPGSGGQRPGTHSPVGKEVRGTVSLEGQMESS